MLNGDKYINFLSTLNKNNIKIPLLVNYLKEFGKSNYTNLSQKFGNTNVNKLIDNGVLLEIKNKVSRLDIKNIENR